MEKRDSARKENSIKDSDESANSMAASKDKTIDDVTQYKSVQAQLSEKVEDLLTKGRFVAFKERERKSSFGINQLKPLSHGKYKTFWRGMQIMKDPLDSTICEQLLWHEKPKTIIEIGAYTGASAVWMADTMKSYNLPCQVYSLDKDLSLLHPLAREYEGVHFVEGDADQVAQWFPENILKTCAHPWLIVEDAHVNLDTCLSHFHKYMEPGDYLIIEDTCPYSPRVAGQGLLSDYEEWGDHKLNVLSEFMAKYEPFYAVDTFYTDYFGYNGTFNWDGFIKRVK